jgi:hypothetical protein
MMEKGIVEKYPGGEVDAFTSEEQERERREAAEVQLVGLREEGNDVSYLSEPQMMKDRLEKAEAEFVGLQEAGNDVSYLSDPERISDRLDKIEIELVDNTLKEHQLNAEKEMLTNKLKDLKAQEN